MCGVLSLENVLTGEKLGDFKVKALDVIERTRPAMESAAFKALQREFKEKRIAVRFLTEGAYTAKFVNAKDQKEYFVMRQLPAG